MQTFEGIKVQLYPIVTSRCTEVNSQRHAPVTLALGRMYSRTHSVLNWVCPVVVPTVFMYKIK